MIKNLLRIIVVICVWRMFKDLIVTNIPESAKAAITTVYGDVNGDGVVNIFDNIYIKKNVFYEDNTFPITNWRESTKFNKGNSFFKCISDQKKMIFGLDNDLGSDDKINKFIGVDISRWQGDIDWKKVSRDGIDFALIKAGYHYDVESSFEKNITEAQKSGLQCGIYWFSTARSIEESVAEAKVCIETIKNYRLEYPVIYDFEYEALDSKNPLTYNKKLCTDAICAFLEEIQSAGYYSMFYSSKYFSDHYLEFDRIANKYDYWYTKRGVSEPDVKCGIWQYTWDGVVDGISGNVDMNISYKDYRSIMEKYSINGFGKILDSEENQIENIDDNAQSS